MGVLLLGADYYGSLAAARCYGRSGIDVAMANDNPRARGLYSRHVRTKLEHPPLSEPARLIEWLVDYGERHPGTLLYPPSDHLAWLFAAHRERLDTVFLTFAPGEDALISLLDKKRLHDACMDVGIDVPATYSGSGAAAESARLRRDLRSGATAESARLRRDLRSGATAESARLRRDLRSGAAAESARLRRDLRSGAAAESARLRRDLRSGAAAESARLRRDLRNVDGLRYPVLVKPRTQVFLEGGIKGFIAYDKNELARELARFRRLVRFDRVLTDRHPDIAAPLVQEYLPAAETNILSVSGFVTKSGELVCRMAMKVLQRPRKVGIGLCFEGRPVDEGLVRKLAALCERVGYYGCFEAELIAEGARHLLIDFNPRFYSQMGFDIARGLVLPMLVWHASRGDEPRLREEISRARAWQWSGSEVYCHKTMFDLLLALQGISGEMSRGDVKRWRRWYADHRAAATDAVRDPDDRMPTVIDAAQWVEHFTRHPRSFVRSFVLNR